MFAHVCDRLKQCAYAEANLNAVQRGMKWSSLVDMLQYHIVVLCSHFVSSRISLDQRHRLAYHMYHVSDMIEKRAAQFHLRGGRRGSQTGDCAE